MRARKKGDGSFRKLKTGQIELTISNGYDIFGKRLRYRFYGSTESECRKKYKEFIKSGGESKRATDDYSIGIFFFFFIYSNICRFLCGWTHTRKTTYSEARLKNISISYKK